MVDVAKIETAIADVSDEATVTIDISAGLLREFVPYLRRRQAHLAQLHAASAIGDLPAVLA